MAKGGRVTVYQLSWSRDGVGGGKGGQCPPRPDPWGQIRVKLSECPPRISEISMQNRQNTSVFPDFDQKMTFFEPSLAKNLIS